MVRNNWNFTLFFYSCLILPIGAKLEKSTKFTKLQFYPFGVNWGLLSIFGPITPKSKNPHKFNYLNLFMLNETILEIPVKLCQLNFGKNKLEIILSFWGGLGADFHIWVHWPKIKKRPQIERLWYSWSVKYLADPLLPMRKRLWQDILCFLNICFVKFLICAY